LQVVTGTVQTPGPGRVELRAAAADRSGLPGCALVVAPALRRNARSAWRLTVITALRTLSPDVTGAGPCIAFSRAQNPRLQPYPLLYLGLQAGSGALEVGDLTGPDPRIRRVAQIIPLHRTGRRSCVWGFSVEPAQEQAGSVAVQVEIDGDWVGTWMTDDLPMTFAPYALGADVEYQVVGREATL
jgi:hypothetical protein